MTERDCLTQFKEARLGMFIHWGLYSRLGRGEWVMCRDRIPHEEYARLADEFSPRFFDPDRWCGVAKNAGMGYMVMTTRHHDGFALFDSAASDFTSAKTAANRDFVLEYVEACRRNNMKVGLYYSLGDWRFGIPKESDSPEKAKAMVEQAHAQVRELMTNYGKIDILWYDGGWAYPSIIDHGPDDVKNFWRAEELNGMVRELQPNIVINDRSGTPEDFGTPENEISVPAVGRAWEVCMTMGGGANSFWGWLPRDPLAKTTGQLIGALTKAASLGGNFLLNVSPDGDGMIPEWQLERLERIGEWMRANGESIYGVGPSEMTRDVNGQTGSSSGICGDKGDTIYHYMYLWPGKKAIVPFVKGDVVDVTLLATGKQLEFERDSAGRLLISGLPLNPPDPNCSVMKIVISD